MGIKRIKGNQFVLDKEDSVRIYTEAKQAVGSVYKNMNRYVDGIVDEVIKKIASGIVADYAYTVAKVDIEKNDFITISVTADISFVVSVGITDDKLVFGVLEP